MTVANAYQGEFNGLTFGAGTDVKLSKLTGLRAMPPLRRGDSPKPRRNGSWAGLDLLDERVMILDLEVFAPVAPFEQVVSALATAFQPISDPSQQLPLGFLLPGWVEQRIITCRPTRGELPIDQWFQFNRASVPIEMTANDPLIYSNSLHSASTGLPSPTAGLTFNATPDFVFGASTGGSMSVTNLGNYITAPVFTITGPVLNPMFTYTPSGQFMQVNIALGVSDVLVIDMGAQTVTLNGTASRKNAIAQGSSWFGFPPGTWSIGVASSDSAPVAAVFTATWRDAWGWM